ncbi:MAG: radical SAM protein [Myxococcales bacterium]|nr:MAG: radical SAM protein [Myxococcales bacterium]
MVQLPPRPRHLPIAPEAGPAHRHLPLAGPSRPIDQRWQPVYAVWEITLRCDLSCRHCGSRAGRARPDELTTAECLDMVTQMADLGVKEVTLIGGEAYLRDDWAEIASAVRSHGMACGITTGGRGFTPERARMAKDAGVQSVSVSVDGLRDVHDRLRGAQGSYDAALASLDNLHAVGMPVSANTQFCRYNIHEMPELLEQLIVHHIHSWQIQLTVAMGRAADEPDMLLQPWQMLEVMPGFSEEDLNPGVAWLYCILFFPLPAACLFRYGQCDDGWTRESPSMLCFALF